jgi:hypothetical protein
VAAEAVLEPGLGRAPPNHAVRVDAVHRLVRERAGFANRGAEEEAFALAPEPAGIEILIDEGFELVVRRHLVAPAAFLVQPHPPALAFRVVVLDLHRHDSADARQGVGHHRYQRAIAQPHEPWSFRFGAVGQGD